MIAGPDVLIRYIYVTTPIDQTDRVTLKKIPCQIDKVATGIMLATNIVIFSQIKKYSQK